MINTLLVAAALFTSNSEAKDKNKVLQEALNSKRYVCDATLENGNQGEKDVVVVNCRELKPIPTPKPSHRAPRPSRH